MTKEALAQMIKDVAGTEIAGAFQRLQERQASQPALTADALTERAQSAEATRKAGLVFGGMCAALAQAKMNLGAAVDVANKWNQPDVVKALQAGTAVDGGVLIAPEHSDRVIDLLVGRTVVRKHVADVVDIGSGSIDMARITSDAASSWGGEVTPVPATQGAMGQLTMRAFQHKVMVPISNTLLRRGGPRVNTIVQNGALRSMSLGEDLVFLTSPGSEFRPKGLRYWAPEANQLTMSTWSGTEAAKLTAATQDLGRMMLAQEEANVPGTGNFWAFSPRTKQYLLTVRDGNGNFVYRDEMLQGKLWGIPFEGSTQVSNSDNGAGGTIYLVDGDELMLGQGASLQVELSSEATYVDGSGNVISAFQRNLTLLRIINEVDLRPKHEEAVVTLGGVTWAPTA